MNHRSVQQERGWIDWVVPAGSPSQSMEEVGKLASAFVLTVTKGRKESQPKVKKDMNWRNVINRN